MESTVHLARKEDVADLRAVLERHLPSACDIYQKLESLLRSPTDATKFYFTRGRDGNFTAAVGLALETCADQDGRIRKIWITCNWTDTEEDLVQIYRAISDIDWEDDGIIAFWSGHEQHPIYPILLTERLVDYEVTKIVTYCMEMETAFALELKLPDDVYVKSLERVHAPTVYKHWPYSSSTKVEHMADEIDRHPSAGLFLKDGDQLVSWIMIHPPNGMSRLFTLESHRRKGYASLVIGYTSKRMAQSGYVPFANVKPENSASVQLFESLGFQRHRRRHMFLKQPHNCLNVKLHGTAGNP